jgi:hypothetical protein
MFTAVRIDLSLKIHHYLRHNLENLAAKTANFRPIFDQDC